MSDTTASPPAVRLFADPEALGAAAARDIAAALTRRLDSQPQVRVMFASAPSQEATLRHLAQQPGISWDRVTAFHMDEYLGLAADAPQRFGTWLRGALLDRVGAGTVHLISPGDDAQATAAGYSQLLAAAPIDICCLGIGVNGHLAFNDPPASFTDAELVRVVTLDEVSRRQQVDDGCFAALADVPAQAVTVTVPALLSAAELFCMVPGARKKQALTDALYGPVDGRMPASALRTHPRCTIYADTGSAPDAR